VQWCGIDSCSVVEERESALEESHHHCREENEHVVAILGEEINKPGITSGLFLGI